MIAIPLGIGNFRGDGEARDQLVSDVCGDCGLAPIFVSALNVEGCLVGRLELCTAPDSPFTAPLAVVLVRGFF
ncbi:hypothetical protein [Brucella haematophila]|uniref:hypothetical protein n=1 Tax=Brucella haematophila TaxID=419474 RepID=UPI004041372B